MSRQIDASYMIRLNKSGWFSWYVEILVDIDENLLTQQERVHWDRERHVLKNVKTPVWFKTEAAAVRDCKDFCKCLGIEKVEEFHL